jgi:hypothetical protein
VILITQKSNLLKKPKKVKINQRKSEIVKIKETCGDMLGTNKASKGYVTATRCILDIV